MLRRWSTSSRVLLVASAVLAVVAGAVVRGYAESARAAAAAIGSRVPVVVAARPIARGTLVRASQIRVVRIPRAFAPPGAFARGRQVAGRAALTDLAPGEAVTDTRLARVRAGPVASLVPQGLRAFAVPTSLPVGAVVPGDRVDVMATFGTGGAGQPHTESVVDSVEVLFVLGPGDAGSTRDGGLSLDISASGAAAAVTLILLVAPDQEQRLAYARAFADLQVAVAPAPESAPPTGSGTG